MITNLVRFVLTWILDTIISRQFAGNRTELIISHRLGWLPDDPLRVIMAGIVADDAACGIQSVYLRGQNPEGHILQSPSFHSEKITR